MEQILLYYILLFEIKTKRKKFILLWSFICVWKQKNYAWILQWFRYLVTILVFIHCSWKNFLVGNISFNLFSLLLITNIVFIIAGRSSKKRKRCSGKYKKLLHIVDGYFFVSLLRALYTRLPKLSKSLILNRVHM